MAKQSGENQGEKSNVVAMFAQAASPLSAALDETFRRKRPMLIEYLRFRLGDPVEAHDVAQAAFVRLWERRESLHGNNLDALLFVTARNLANDLVRGRMRHRRMLNAYSDDLEDDMSTLNTPDRALEARERLEVVRESLNELSANCREAFVRHRVHGHDYDDIARDMGVSQSMVRKHVIRAISHCAARLLEREGSK
jgi:RNA polymerase sigma factor (sigma-70 family)